MRSLGECVVVVADSGFHCRGTVAAVRALIDRGASRQVEAGKLALMKAGTTFAVKAKNSCKNFPLATAVNRAMLYPGSVKKRGEE